MSAFISSKRYRLTVRDKSCDEPLDDVVYEDAVGQFLIFNKPAAIDDHGPVDSKRILINQGWIEMAVQLE